MTLDLSDTRASRGRVEARDLPGPRVRREPRDRRVNLDRRVHRETVEQLEWLERKDRLVQLDTSGPRDHRELLVHRETLDSLDSKDLMVQMDSRAYLGQLEQLAQRVLSATTDRMVLRVERVQPVWPVTRATPVLMDNRARAEAREFPDR